MKKIDLSRAGWYLLSLLVLFLPLLQGGSPRLPSALVQVAVFALGILWAVEWGWLKPFQSFRLTAVDGLLSLFVFLAVYSYLFAPYQHAALRSLLDIGMCCLLYWFLVHHRSRRAVEFFLGALIVAGVAQSGLMWYGLVGGEGTRPSGTFYNPNFAAAFVASASLAALGYAVFPFCSRWLQRAAAASAALFMAGAVVMTQSRGGILALLAGAVVLLAGKSTKLMIGLLTGASLLLLAVPNPFTARLSGISADVYAYSRISMWKSAVQMMLDHPWFGVGLGQYRYFSPRYAFPVDAHWAKFGRVAHTPHSEYLQVGAELGFPGLLVCLAAAGVVVTAAAGAMRKATGPDRHALVCLASVATLLLVHAAVDFPLHSPPLALLLTASAAGLRILGAEGPSWVVEFRFRKVYGFAVAALLLFPIFLSVRPVLAFRHYLGGLGAPQSLMREKWALEEAERTAITDAEAISRFEKAVALDPGNATYHNALGSLYFKARPGSAGEEEARKKALYHGNFALELNPNNYRFALSLGQAMESLHRLSGDERFLVMAAEKYRLARSLAPKHFAIVEKAAFIEEQLGNRAAAEEAYRTVVSLEPNYIRGWYNLAMYLANQERVAEALAALAAGESARARVTAPPLTTYEEKLLDFDMELLAETRELLAGGAGRGR